MRCRKLLRRRTAVEIDGLACGFGGNVSRPYLSVAFALIGDGKVLATPLCGVSPVQVVDDELAGLAAEVVVAGLLSDFGYVSVLRPVLGPGFRFEPNAASPVCRADDSHRLGRQRRSNRA